jgi:Xaa-Pro aminopeptidase
MKSQNFSKKRIEELMHRLPSFGAEACLIDSPVDLFYLTGIALSHGLLIVTHKEARLFVDGRYIQVAEEKSPVPVALEEKEAILAYLEQKKAKKIAFDSDSTHHSQFLKLSSWLPSKELLPIASPLRDQRLIKDKQESLIMKRAAKIAWQGFLHIRKKLKKGVTECDLALEFETFCRKKGAQKLSFDPIIAFGKNSAMPHYRSSNTKLKEGDAVLIDVGVVVDSYCSDMTRTLFFGKGDPILVRFAKIVHDAQKAALKLCKPGTKLGDLDRAAREVMKKEGVEKHFIHSLGHGVGLEIHEWPRIKAGGEDQNLLLKPGMAITIEPGLYLPGKGGIRYEDTILITSISYQNFYPS